MNLIALMISPFLFLFGALYPADRIAAAIIRQTLVKCGLNPIEYPIDKMAGRAVTIARFRGETDRDWYRSHLRGCAEAQALLAAGPDRFSEQFAAGTGEADG
jgi:hypothetical protein